MRRLSLSLLAAVCLAAPSFAQTPPGPPAQPPGPERGEPRPPVDVTGASDIDYDVQTEQYTFRGEHVVVVRGEQRLEATEILYSGATRLAVLPHGGTISTPTMELSADRITADLARRHFLAEGSAAGRMLDEGIWTTLRAAHLAADDRPDLRRADATGDVVAVRNDEELRADHVIYDRLSRHSTAEGHAVLTKGTDRLTADRVVMDLATDDAEATGHPALVRGSQELHGTGDVVTYSRRTNTAVLSGHAVVVRRKDTVTADRITVHLDRNEAVADGRAVVVSYPNERSEPAPP